MSCPYSALNFANAERCTPYADESRTSQKAGAVARSVDPPVDPSVDPSVELSVATSVVVDVIIVSRKPRSDGANAAGPWGVGCGTCDAE